MGRVNVTVSDAIELKLKDLAKEHGTSASAIAAYGIQAYLEFIAHQKPIPAKTKK